MDGNQAENLSGGRASAGRELIVIVKPEAGVRVTRTGITSATGADVTELNRLIASEGVTLKPLFGSSEERLKAKTSTLASQTSADVPDLSIYYRVEAPDDRLDGLADLLREHDVVQAAYVKPAAQPPQQSHHEVLKPLNTMIPSEEDSPPTVADFTALQGYLNPAPGGVDARYAWTIVGGTGEGVNLIDVEGAWRFTHEDLQLHQGGVVAGSPSTDLKWRNHGTAVMGEIGADNNDLGVTGIAPDTYKRAISIFGDSASSTAIHEAADLLNKGDILLIELHRPGPRYNFMDRDDQLGYIAVEWWDDDFAAIRYATSKGVIVVEAAGNGAENLDDALYETRPAYFLASWTNPFNRSNRDSGAILVGAGAPPSETWGPDRSRLNFSNYGASIDAQGWGEEVVTCGYGDLEGGQDENLWYTRSFSGTSSASPIVVGVLACVQGVLLASGYIPLSPALARELLRTSGSPQQDAVGRPSTQRIGNRPDLQQLIPMALNMGGWEKQNVPLAVVFILWGGTTGADGIGILPNGHVIHIPGNNPDPWREILTHISTAKSLTVEMQHISNAHIRQQMQKLATEMFRGAAESAKALIAEESTSVNL